MLLSCLTIAAFILTGVAIASLATYKPWGVRDNDREKYDQIVARSSV